MRTTVRLPDDLHAEAKRRAASLGVSFTQLLEDALRLLLRDDLGADDGALYCVDPLPAGDGVQDGVDLTDSAALADLMDDR